MRIVLSQEGWVFDGLTGLEWLFLRRLPAVVDELSSDDGARSRLFPDPIAKGEGEAREGSGADEDDRIVDDWKEFVRPELVTVFDEACRTVAIDLEAVKQSVSVEVDGVDPEEVFYSLAVPGEHVELWNSALNQARVLMNEVHDLAQSEKSLAEDLLDAVDEKGDERSRQAVAYPQWLLLAQYGFYGAIQSFLIEQVMDV